MRLASDDKSSAPSSAKKALTKKLSVPLVSKVAGAEENDPEKPGARQHTNFNQKMMKLKNSAKNLFNNNNNSKQMDCQQSCESKKDLETRKDDSRILQFPSGRQDSKTKNWLNKLSYKFTANEQTTSNGVSKKPSKMTSWRSGTSCDVDDDDLSGKPLISALPGNPEPGMRMHSTDPSFPVLSEFHTSEYFRPTMAVLPRSPSSPFMAVQSPELPGRRRRQQIKMSQGCERSPKSNDREQFRTGFVDQNSSHHEPRPLQWDVRPQKPPVKTSPHFQKSSPSWLDSPKLKPAFLFPSNYPSGASVAPASMTTNDCKRSSFEEEVLEPFDRYTQSKLHSARQRFHSSKTEAVRCTDDVPLAEDDEHLGREKTCHSFGDMLDTLDIPDCQRFYSEDLGRARKPVPPPKPFGRKDDRLQLSKDCYESLDVRNCQKQVFHVVTLDKCELDRANKDVQNKVVPSDFQVIISEIYFVNNHLKQMLVTIKINNLKLFH